MRIRKIIFICALLSLVLFGTGSRGIRLIRLTVVNKSGLALEMSLTGDLEDNDYYLRVPKGTPLAPFTQVFTIIPDDYAVTIYHVEFWDPVYGFDCSSRSISIDATHNSRLVVPVCTYSPPNSGEPSMAKLGGAGGRGGARGPR
jgi:hypothetical protein